MKLSTKKIIAREFLIFITLFFIGIAFLVASGIWSGKARRKLSKVYEHVVLLEERVSSIKFEYSFEYNQNNEAVKLITRKQFVHQKAGSDSLGILREGALDIQIIDSLNSLVKKQNAAQAELDAEKKRVEDIKENMNFWASLFFIIAGIILYPFRFIKWSIAILRSNEAVNQ